MIIFKFKRGHPCGVNFDFVSLIHCQARLVDPTIRKSKFNSQEILISKSLWDNVVSNLDDHMTNFSLLIPKSNQVVEKLAMAE